jgi:hypothetical protein
MTKWQNALGALAQLQSPQVFAATSHFATASGAWQNGNMNCERFCPLVNHRNATRCPEHP